MNGKSWIFVIANGVKQSFTSPPTPPQKGGELFSPFGELRRGDCFGLTPSQCRIKLYSKFKAIASAIAENSSGVSFCLGFEKNISDSLLMGIK